MSQKRRFSAEKKVEILREYLENQVSISELADKYQLSPSQIYQCALLQMELDTRKFYINALLQMELDTRKFYINGVQL
jgi:transposase-like protein